jgi:glycosyltransferase involved in cell wall biosynthesis
MKTAILTPTFSKFSGPDRVVLNEAEERASKKNEVVVFTFKTDFDVGELSKRGIKVEVLGMPGNSMLERIYRLFFFVDLPKVLKISNMLKGFDEVISFLYPMTLPAMIAKNRNKNLKYVYYDVGIAYPRLFGSLSERVYMRLFGSFTKKTIKNADSAISISKFLSDELKKDVGLSSSVKYVKIDTKRFNKNTIKKHRKEISGVIRKFGLKKPVLLYVGRISPHKGIHILLEAFGEVKKELPDARLVIVGKHTFGSYSNKLKKIASRIGGIVFAGFVPDEELPAYYGACDVYVTASLWEGFDIPIVEANTLGKPSVAFRVGSHAEVLKKGVLVDKLNSKELANAIVKVISRT